MSKREKHSADQTEVQIVRERIIEDREYNLIRKSCSCCGDSIFYVYRFAGVNFASYKLPPEFEVEDFVDFVEQIDETLAISASDLMADYRVALNKVNSPEGIEADNTYAFQLIEYARQRCSLLDKLGFLDVLTQRVQPADPTEQAVRAAFELGVSAAEHRVMNCYEEYMLDGMALSEWRQAGLPAARQERLRRGRKTRDAIARAAKQLYAQEPGLYRNDTETARRILLLRLPGLQKDNGGQVGIETIVKHLRVLRDTLAVSHSVAEPNPR